jgi:hypothetical protein
VRIRVDPAALRGDLYWHFERAGFDVEEIGSDSLAVERLDAPDPAQAWRETDLHLRIWEAMHPKARVRQSAS